MTEDLKQILVVQIIGILSTSLLAGIPAFSQWRKWKTGEREQVNSVADKVEAEAVSIWQKTYADLREMLVKMTKEAAEQTQEIAKLTARTILLEGQLAAKAQSEAMLQSENVNLKLRVGELEAILKQERSERTAERERYDLEMQAMKDRLFKLESQNVGTTSLPLSGD